MIAKQLIPMQMLICASPVYARRRDLPESVEDVAEHTCVRQRLSSGRLRGWNFKVDGRACSITPQANLTFNDPELVLQAALDGEGLAQLAAYQVCDALRAGSLVTCLEQCSPTMAVTICAI